MAATSTSVLGAASSLMNTEREGAMSPEDASLAIHGRVDTRPRVQKTQLPDWDSVSTQLVAVSTLVSAPRRPILRKWDSVSTHSLVVSTHSS
ncbi:hypothetical protein Taro_011657 [Colocasia esculenta]|uniref:Uncharacterized protein n=1 Tax=Colocasia esculenta TaxID=4460 RepID=A0A843U6W5_COLES|nr:hypothetical protein [Colocasia esculenta]